MPKFSVVIAVFNKERQIADTLRSVLNQTFADFEVVMVNDGSTDASEKVIKSFDDDRIRYFSQANQGAGGARNAAIEKATAQYIALLDADDYWYPEYLERQNSLIEKYPEARVFATAAEIKRDGRLERRIYTIDLNEGEDGMLNFFESSCIHPILHSSSTVIHRDVFSTIGMYDTKILSGEDTDLYVRIGLNYPIAFLNAISSRYEITDDGLFKTMKSIENKANFDRYEDIEKDNPALKKYLDLNRYSLAIFSKLNEQPEAAETFISKIDPNNLNKRQRFLLGQNKTSLKYLLKLKDGLSKYGIRLSAFK